MEVTDLAREKIQTYLLNLKLKTNDKYVVRGMLICLPCLILGLVVCLLFFYFKSFVPVIIGLIIIFVGIAFSIYFIVNVQKISRFNQQKLANTGQDLHQIFFTNAPKPFDPKINFKFDGIHPSELWDFNCFHFGLGDETIVWDIAEDIEIRTRTIYTGRNTVTQTYKVYILKYALNSTAKKLAGIEEIWISQGKTPKNNESFLHSESIEFNQRFKVQSQDQMQVYKVFTPKVIDNFLLTEEGFLGLETIKLEDKRAIIERQGTEALKSWVPEPLDYSKIRWSKNHLADDITKKLQTDFNRYLKIQAMLMPLDIYN